MKLIDTSGLILGLRPANERRRYFVTTSLIGWVQAQNQPHGNHRVIECNKPSHCETTYKAKCRVWYTLHRSKAEDRISDKGKVKNIICVSLLQDLTLNNGFGVQASNLMMMILLSINIYPIIEWEWINFQTYIAFEEKKTRRLRE